MGNIEQKALENLIIEGYRSSCILFLLELSSLYLCGSLDSVLLHMFYKPIYHMSIARYIYHNNDDVFLEM